jgi:hypothetical protein
MYRISQEANKGISKLSDIFPEEAPVDALAHLKRITQWIESQPLSKLPYVQIGFDSLSSDIVSKIEEAVVEIKEENKAAKIECEEIEALQPYHVFQENFPFWVSPFANNDIGQFKVGDRVMNINSMRRQYIPFGFRGTVIGMTSEEVIVLFDEQFLAGENIHNHCKEYRGAMLKPNQIINITKRFKAIKQSDPHIVERFL